MIDQAVNLYLEANGITVTGNTDQYYRLSGDKIKTWANDAPIPTSFDLKPFDVLVEAEEQKKKDVQSLDAADKKMARIGEEVIDLLIAKNIISLSELPPETQEVYTDRKTKAAKVRK